MQELMKLLIKNQITPDQFFLLDCIQESIMSQDLLPNKVEDLKELKNKQFLDGSNTLTTKALNLLDDAQKLFVIPKNKKKNDYITEEFLENLQEFREIFPNQKLPSGKAARTNLDDLKRKMVEFMIKYPRFDWNTILDAATYYVETYRKADYMFMKTAGYYIMKNNESDLATDCELLLEGGMEELQKKNSLYNVR